MIRFNRCKPYVFSLLALLLLIAQGGCGYKDRPVPPQEVVPRAVTDLRYQLSEKGVTLQWSYPIETVTGNDLPEVSDFVVYRAVVAVNEYCETCPLPFGQPILVPGGSLPGEGKKTATYETMLLRPGNLYFFKVRSKAGWWAESADSNTVSFLWDTPPAAPAGLITSAGDGTINLRWQPVTSHLDGTAVTQPIRYQVERSLGGASFAAIGTPLAETSYTDSEVLNGRKYFYRVQAMAAHKQGNVGGGFSETVAATPLDRTPPAPPVGVKGVLTANGVKIFWDAARESDLKGYRIYRRLPGENASIMVGEVHVPYTLFVDRTPPTDVARLFYSVSCIDMRTPVNESVRSPEVMIKR